MNSIVALMKAYHQGERSPVDLINELLARIESSSLNAYITVMTEQARAEARQAQAQLASGSGVGPLTGVPIAIKDLVDVAGYRTTMGSQQFAENFASEDAEVVRLLRQAGAIIIGKANTHQFAYGSTGDRSDFGTVRHPRDASRVPGGSSSGSAASVAAGLAYGAVGTDTSASIRLPAALCGVAGMKATFGLVSRQGVYPLSHTLDHIGPISTDVRDNALLLEVLAARAPGTYSSRIGQDIRGLVIGVPSTFYAEYLSPAMHRSMVDARQALADAGAVLKPVEIDHIYPIYDAQQFVLKAEAYAQHADALQAGAPFIQEVKDRLLTGQGVLASDYLRHLKYQSTARACFDQALTEVDVLLTPTCGITAPLQDERISRINDEDRSTPWLLTRLTAPTNFSGHPSLSVPYGQGDDGMPLSVQLIGRWHEEATLYQVASCLEAS